MLLNGAGNMASDIKIKWNEKYFTINEKKLSEISNKLNKNIYIDYKIKQEHTATKINIIIMKKVKFQIYHKIYLKKYF